MARDTMPKIEAVTMPLRLPKEVEDRFTEAARLISEITPKKPVSAADLAAFMLLKNKVGEIVIEFLEFVQNCDDSILFGPGGDRSQSLSHHRTNGH